MPCGSLNWKLIRSAAYKAYAKKRITYAVYRTVYYHGLRPYGCISPLAKVIYNTGNTNACDFCISTVSLSYKTACAFGTQSFSVQCASLWGLPPAAIGCLAIAQVAATAACEVWWDNIQVTNASPRSLCRLLGACDGAAGGGF